MPILVGSAHRPPVVPGRDLDRIDVTWIAPDGTEWPLMQPQLGYWALIGLTGWGAAPVTLTDDALPRGGSSMRHIQPQPRLITMPMMVRAPSGTHADFILLWRSLGAAFAQTRRKGPGILRVRQPNGDTRQIAAYYQSGWEQDSSLGVRGMERPIVTLYCPDPYWRPVSPISLTKAFVGGDPLDFLSPWPSLTDDRTLGAMTITNPGDAEAWPTWTITGPADGITATREDTGDSWSLTPIGGPLTEGQTITVATDPPQILGPDGSSWVGALNWPEAVLFDLDPGANPIDFVVSGSDTGTSVTLSFYPRYETV